MKKPTTAMFAVRNHTFPLGSEINRNNVNKNEQKHTILSVLRYYFFLSKMPDAMKLPISPENMKVAPNKAELADVYPNGSTRLLMHAPKDV